MADYLDFRDARCRDCYKCLRNCPVKAITVKGHQARVIEERCILCGRCTVVCPQNAKVVHSELSDVVALLKDNSKVIASVAPSIISSFNLHSFEAMRQALKKIGFYDAEETAVGAAAVTEEYRRLMEKGGFKNFITSACPAVCRMIQHYYPQALPYLAPVDSPMFAHAKIILNAQPDAKIVFIGPCIAKKREAMESGIIAHVLTFEELDSYFKSNNIDLEAMETAHEESHDRSANIAKAYPISHGIITSFGQNLPKGYDYMAVDGAERCTDVLENIENLSGMFIEINACKDACVGGPCSIQHLGGSIKATSDIREYVNKEIATCAPHTPQPVDIDLSIAYPRIRDYNKPPTEKDITAILAKTGKTTPADELNCGACGYSTCREKAWAVYNGYADIELCIPYMRQRAQSMSYEIMRHNPDGIIVLNDDYTIVEINDKACELLGIPLDIKGQLASDYFNVSDFMQVKVTGRPITNMRQHIIPTDQYVDFSINIIKEHNMLCAVLKDVTQKASYEEKIHAMKMETLETTDEVIKKQMRVAQEIASLLGETTAETKVALLKLKETLQKE